MTHNPKQLDAFEWPMVRLYCPDCHRFARYRKTTLTQSDPGSNEARLTELGRVPQLA